MSKSGVSALEDFDVQLDYLDDNESDDEEVNFKDLSWQRVNPGSSFNLQDNAFYGLHGSHPRYEGESEDEIFIFEIVFPDEVFQMLACQALFYAP